MRIKPSCRQITLPDDKTSLPDDSALVYRRVHHPTIILLDPMFWNRSLVVQPSIESFSRNTHRWMQLIGHIQCRKFIWYAGFLRSTTHVLRVDFMTEKTTPSFDSFVVFIRHFGSGRGRTGSRLAPVSKAMHTYAHNLYKFQIHRLRNKKNPLKWSYMLLICG